MSKTSELLRCPSVRDFFAEAVEQAAGHHALQPDAAISCYLVDLLCAYLAAPPAFDRPLGALMRDSIMQQPSRRLDHLKQAGDEALYVSGYFGASLSRRGLDATYYRTIGGTAYRELSRLVGRRGSSQLAEVYAELAKDFREFVAVLSTVRNQTESVGADIGELYEQWLRSGDRGVKHRLQAAGMIFGRSNSNEN